jgi:hypothetical protein
MNSYFIDRTIFDRKILISLLAFMFILPSLTLAFDFHTMEHNATVTLTPNISSCAYPLNLQ